jgi:hypothetical protein
MQHAPLLHFLIPRIAGANEASYTGEEVHDFMMVRDAKDACQVHNIIEFQTD